MSATVKAGDLARELGRVLRVIERKATLPALQYVLAEPVESGLQLTATDLDVVLRAVCEMEGLATAPMLLPAERLHDVVRTLPADAPVEMSVGKNGELEVKAAAYRGKLRSLPVEEFPKMPEPPSGGVVARISSDALRLMVDRTHHALMSEATQSKPGLHCGHLVVNAAGKTLSLTCCDGYRLSRAKSACVPGDGDAEVLVPGKAVRELRGFLDEDAEVTARDGESHIFFQSGARMLVTRKTEDKYPAVERIIPKANTETFEVGRVALASAVRRVSGVDDAESRSVRLVVSKAGLEVAAQGDQTGDAAETVGIDYTGDGVTVKVQARFVTDFLDALPAADKVRFAIKAGGGGAPILVEAVGPDVMAVIVPMTK